MNVKLPKIIILYLTLAVILIIVVTIIIINLLSTNEQNTQDLLPTPTSIALPSKPQNTSTIKEETVTPKEDITGKSIKNPSQNITFTLSENVNPETINVITNPSIPTKIKRGASQNEIVILPDPPEYWRPNTTYLITILDSNKEIITSYTIKVPEYIPEEDVL